MIIMPLSGCNRGEDEKKGQEGIKNVILLIPDGGGYGPYDFANAFKIAGGFDREVFPNATKTNEDPMFMRDYLVASAVTLNCLGTITDSAAGGTAISSGYKTVNGYIGVNPNKIPVATILETAQFPRTVCLR